MQQRRTDLIHHAIGVGHRKEKGHVGVDELRFGFLQVGVKHCLSDMINLMGQEGKHLLVRWQIHANPASIKESTANKTLYVFKVDTFTHVHSLYVLGNDVSQFLNGLYLAVPVILKADYFFIGDCLCNINPRLFRLRHNERN
jgi:hypothetical protein